MWKIYLLCALLVLGYATYRMKIKASMLRDVTAQRALYHIAKKEGFDQDEAFMRGLENAHNPELFGKEGEYFGARLRLKDPMSIFCKEAHYGWKGTDSPNQVEDIKIEATTLFSIRDCAS